MATLTTDHVGFWPYDTDATALPANWTEDDAYRSRYLHGVADVTGAGGTEPANGGNATHLHTTSHGLTGVAHDHDFSGAAVTPAGGNAAGLPPDITVSAYNHSHGLKNFPAIAITYQADITSTSANAMLPAFFPVVVMNPDDDEQDYPDNAIGFTNESTSPAGYDIADGNGGTVDLDGRFLRGQTGAGEGGDANKGGSDTHNHTQASHTHDEDLHVHASTRCAVSSGLSLKVAAGLDNTPYLRDHHDITGQATTTANLDGVDNPTTTVANASSLPAYTNLLGVQNTSGGALTSPGLILGWKATAASIPLPWRICDGTYGTPDLVSTQIRSTTNSSLNGATGGSNSHVHEITHDDEHTHTGTHTHTVSIVNVNTTNAAAGAAARLLPVSTKDDHIWTVSAETPTLVASPAFDTAAADGRYLYRELIWVKYYPVTVWIRGLTKINGLTHLAGV